MNEISLSPNVQRWLERSTPTGFPVPNQIKNTQQGEMDIRGKRMPFTATTVYGREPFTFTWTACLKINRLMRVIAVDGHDSSQGWGSAKLWGVIPMGGQQGSQVFAMQMVRSLAEIPWFPNLAVALPGLNWTDWDKGFDVSLETEGQIFTVRFEMNQYNDIIRASSERNFDVPEGFELWPWQYDFSCHQEIDGVRIPLSATATYHRPDGPWEYWRVGILSITNG